MKYFIFAYFSFISIFILANNISIHKYNGIAYWHTPEIKISKNTGNINKGKTGNNVILFEGRKLWEE